MALNLEAIELIRQLKYRYFRAIDTADMETLKGVFTEDATVCYVGGTYRFEAEGRDNILEALGYAFHAEAIAFHHGNHPEIEVHSDTEASGRWYLRDWFLDLRRKITTDGASFYRDRYEGSGTTWYADGTAEVRRCSKGRPVGKGARWSADRTRAFECRHRRASTRTTTISRKGRRRTKSHVFAFVVDVNSQI